MVKKRTILNSFLLVLLLSCSLTNDKNADSFKCYVTDTSISHRLYNELDFSREKNALLNLSPINKGVDSFELRIWISSGIIPNFLTILKFNQDKWAVYGYWYYASNGDFIDSMIVYNKPVPKEIDKIVSYLQQPEILKLPSQSAIPNFHDSMADGQTCTIEISTRNFYKALQYHCPEHYTKEPNHIKFMQIIKYLNPYFKFYQPWCSPGD